MHMLQTLHEETTMHAIQASITERGQVTLPAAVRRQLGAVPGGKLLFQIEDDGTVTLAAPAFTFQTVRASVPPLPGPLSAEEYEEALDEARTAGYRSSLASKTP